MILPPSVFPGERLTTERETVRWSTGVGFCICAKLKTLARDKHSSFLCSSEREKLTPVVNITHRFAHEEPK